VFEQKAKKYLIELDGYPSWKQFVDHQENGDCYGITHDVAKRFPATKRVFGHIKADNGRLMKHYWIEVNGEIYEFSKGTLKNWIDWENLYETHPEDADYRTVSGKKVRR